MLKSALSICLFPLVFVACTPPQPLQPKIYSAFVASGSTSVTLRGQHLKATRVRLAGQTATVVETSATFDSLRLEVPEPLVSGEFTVQLEFEGLGNVSQTVQVLPGSGDVPAADLGTNREKYLVKGAGFLAVPASLNQSVLDAAISQAGFSRTGSLEPAAGADGVCAQRFVSVQDNQISRGTLEGLSALTNQLGESLPDTVDFELNAVMIHNQPDGSGSTLEAAPRVSPLALPSGLSNVRVAVLDSGINRHPIFELKNGSNAIDFAAAQNFTAEDNPTDPAPLGTDVSDLAKDFNTSAIVGHGTAIAGVILQTLETAVGKDPVSLNAAASIVPIKICEGGNGRCRSSSLVAGVCYATSLSAGSRPVKVINLSLGGELSSSLVQRALENAASHGISIVTSAGNKGLNMARPVNYPAQYSVPSGTPAIPGLLAVGSVNLAGGSLNPSAFSSSGNWVSLTAIGEDVLAPTASGGQGVFNGTSFSAPRVAAAALLLYADAAPSAITPAAVKAKIIAKAKPLSYSSSLCGAGLLDVTQLLNP